MIKLGINGFGRIGRMVFRAAVENFGNDIQVVGINDLLDPDYLAYMLKYDSVHGQFNHDIKVEGNYMIVDGNKIQVFAEKDPVNITWGALGVDVVVESTGFFLTAELAEAHIKAGAKKVIMSAPSKDATPMFVYGVNDKTYAGQTIISNASCTTNCLAPISKVLNDKFGIKRGLMNTIHSYTNDQKILDQPHSDLRRARAAAISIIPTSSGAAKAVGLVIPELKGKLDGFAMRVPTPDGSVVDLTAEMACTVTKEEINAAIKEAAEGSMKGVLQYVDEPIVSVDIIDNTHSSIFDSLLTQVMDGNFVKVVSWYDNEKGYSTRVGDLAAKLVTLL